MSRLSPSVGAGSPDTVRRLTGRRLQVRNARLLRHEPLCRHCRAAGRVTAATELDHIIPLARGGFDHESNLQPLCETCHAKKTLEDFGVWPTVGDDGWPKPHIPRYGSKTEDHTRGTSVGGLAHSVLEVTGGPK
jgi:5-methylcytosine-specific restriction protein A